MKLGFYSLSLLFLFKSLSAFSLMKNQDDFLKQVEVYSKKEFKKRKRWTKRSPFLSTVIANLPKMGNRLLEDNGFKTRYIENEAGLVTKVQIKKDKTVKPLLIFVSGLSGGAQSPSFKRYAMPLAEKNKYHVILVENPTNKNWLKRNKNVLFAGYEAGLNLYLLLKEFVKEVPNYSSISLVAFSLGGHDAAYAAYLDETLGTNYIKGPLLFWSSPIEKLPAIKALREKKRQYKLIVRHMLLPLYKQMAILDPSFGQNSFKWFAHEGPFEEVLKGFMSNELVKLNPFTKILKEGNFTIDPRAPLCSLLPKVKKPMLWINSSNDPVVDKSMMKDCVDSIRSKGNFAYIETRYGGHLAFDRSYGVSMAKRITEDYLDYWLEKGSK